MRNLTPLLAGRVVFQAGRGAPHPIGVTRKAIVLVGVHLDLKQVKYLTVCFV